MDFESIFQFLQNGNPERVAWLVIAFLVFSALVLSATYYIVELFLNCIKTLFSLLKRGEKIVEVPRYVESPVNKEMDRYLIILKKIVDEYSSVKI